MRRLNYRRHLLTRLRLPRKTLGAEFLAHRQHENLGDSTALSLSTPSGSVVMPVGSPTK
jgi:hypothetical protein